MKKILFSLFLAVLLFSLTLATPAYAGPLLEGKVVIGEDFTLKSGETIDGDLVVISGSAVVEAGARITGNVVVMGGSADLAGQVAQNVTVMGGNVTLRSTAEIDQQLAVLGGSITREQGAQVKGGESQGFSFGGSPTETPPVPSARGIGPGRWDPLWAFVQGVLQALVMIVVVSVLALLISALWPEPTTRVSAAIATAPAVAGLLGLLTLVAVPILLGLLAITLCLIPVTVLGAVVFVAAMLFGWVALGLLLGNRLAVAFRWNLPPAGAGLLGTFIVTAIAAPLWFITPLQCLGVPLDIIFACLGLGAVVLTRFGTTPYVSGARPPAPIVAPPPVSEPPAPSAPPPEPPPAPPVPPDLTMLGPEPELPAAPEAASPPPAEEPPAEPSSPAS